MNETRMLALRTMRELLDNDGPDDWDELVACYRALRKAIAKNKPMKRKDSADGVIPSRVKTIYGDGGTVGEAIPPTARGYVVSTAARRDPGG
jgi:hypothetical protein